MMMMMVIVKMVVVFMHDCDMIYLPAQDPHLYPVTGISKVQW
jgi:hypothetical protein